MSYDAAIAAMMAINATIVEGLAVKRKPVFDKGRVFENMKKLSFDGWTGPD